MFEQMKKFLTKKTVYYIESCVYILSIVIVVIANVFGPIQIRMIPLFFILGIIGDIVFNRSVITTIFGAIVSLCIVYISGVTNILENIITSGIFALYIALGELFGSKIKIVYKDYIKKGKKKNNEFKINLIICIAIIIICAGFHNFTDSNIFIYNSCKEKLNEYLSNNYKEEKFEIISSTYYFRGENNFKFNVMNLNDDNVYKFIVYLNKDLDIYDGIKVGLDKKEKTKLEKTFFDIIGEGYDDIQKDISNENGVYELNLEKEVNLVDSESVVAFSKEVADILDSIIASGNLTDIEQVNLYLIDKSDSNNNCISTVFFEGYKKNKEEGIKQGYSYIKNALSIEYID